MQIMCTLTPKGVADTKLLTALRDAGMDAVRINTAHLSGTDQLAAMTTRIKALCPDAAILIDTKGPEIRTTAIDCGTISLAEGDEVTLQGDDTDRPTTAGMIYVNYPLIHTAVRPGDILLIDDGSIELEVISIHGIAIRARVSRGGSLGSRKGLAVKDADIDLPAVSAHDREYIEYAGTVSDIDVVAHSFVRSADDVRAVRAAMTRGLKPIIAKIENQQGIDHLDAILREADGVLIARGDLTAAIGSDRIPAAQALIARKTKAAGLPLYLATNILPSMMTALSPSAEDLQGIDTAISQGVDTMLLTNETATGLHPVESVSVLFAKSNVHH